MRIFLATDQTSLVSWAIRKASNSDVSHVAIEDISRPLIFHSNAKGVHLIHEKKFDFTHIKYAFQFIPEVTHPELVKEAYYECLELLATDYDYWAIVGFALHLMGITKDNPFCDSSKNFCSELLWVFLDACVQKQVIPNILKDYARELFSPEDAKELMRKHLEFFVELRLPIAVDYEEVADD